MPSFSHQPFSTLPHPARTIRTHVRSLLQIPSSSEPISSSPTPTPQDITQLILQQKSPSQALQIFQWASQLPSFHHDHSTYHALIRALVSFRRFETAHQVLDEIPAATGSPPDDATFITIIRGVGRACRTHEALKVLDLMASRFDIKNPSLRIFNSILDVLVKEDIDLAREFYRKKMMGCGIRGNEYTFGILMKGLCRTNRIAEAFKLLQMVKSSGLTPNSVIYNTLIHALCKNEKVGRARSLMSEMVSPSDVTFNILISAYCGEGNLVQALVMLDQCFHLGFIPDIVAITKIVDALFNEDRAMEAVELLERVERKGGVVDVVTYNTMIKGYCRLGKPKAGCRVMKEMEWKGCLPNARTFNELISGFCVAGELDSAIDLFQEMKMDGIAPNLYTFDTIIRGLCSCGRVADGLKLLDTMEEQRGGCADRIGPYNSILYGLYKENKLEEAHKFVIERMGSSFPRAVDRTLRVVGLCKEGNVPEAKKVYDQIIAEGGLPSVLVYASLIDGLCKEGDVREAFHLMNEMVGRDYVPLVSMFNAVISGFCMEGEVGNASKLLEEMLGRGCSPNAGSYGSLVDAMCRKGNFHRAFALLVEMVANGVSPDHLTWEPLLLSLSQETSWNQNRCSDHLDILRNCNT